MSSSPHCRKDDIILASLSFTRTITPSVSLPSRPTVWWRHPQLFFDRVAPSYTVVNEYISCYSWSRRSFCLVGQRGTSSDVFLVCLSYDIVHLIDQSDVVLSLWLTVVTSYFPCMVRWIDGYVILSSWLTSYSGLSYFILFYWSV